MEMAQGKKKKKDDKKEDKKTKVGDLTAIQSPATAVANQEVAAVPKGQLKAMADDDAGKPPLACFLVGPELSCILSYAASHIITQLCKVQHCKVSFKDRQEDQCCQRLVSCVHVSLLSCLCL